MTLPHDPPSPAATATALRIPATDPRVRPGGRSARLADGRLAMAWPATGLHVRFRGTALRWQIENHGDGGIDGTNVVDVWLDGVAQGPRTLTPGGHRDVLVGGLSDDVHEVVVAKRTESRGGLGRVDVLEVAVEGAAPELLPALEPTRRLEAIGDSITCGYGNLASTPTADAPYASVASNANVAYTALAARRLGADHVAVAYSGRGVARNYDDGPGPTMLELYDRLLPDDPAAPRFDEGRAAVPDAFVVNLGTNDTATPGLDRAAFRDRYTALLARLRRRAPQALIVVAVGPMVTDTDPPELPARPTLTADVRGALSRRRKAGDTRLRFLEFSPQTPPYGLNGHPTAATHRAMADELTSLLADELGWVEQGNDTRRASAP